MSRDQVNIVQITRSYNIPEDQGNQPEDTERKVKKGLWSVKFVGNFEFDRIHRREPQKTSSIFHRPMVAKTTSKNVANL